MFYRAKLLDEVLRNIFACSASIAIVLPATDSKVEHYRFARFAIQITASQNLVLPLANGRVTCATVRAERLRSRFDELAQSFAFTREGASRRALRTRTTKERSNESVSAQSVW